MAAQCEDWIGWRFRRDLRAARRRGAGPELSWSEGPTDGSVRTRHRSTYWGSSCRSWSRSFSPPLQAGRHDPRSVRGQRHDPRRGLDVRLSQRRDRHLGVQRAALPREDGDLQPVRRRAGPPPRARRAHGARPGHRPAGGCGWLADWFAPEALADLLAYRSLLERVPGERRADDRVLSRAARSARLVTHFDLDFPKAPQTEPYFCRKHRRMCQPTRDAFKFLRRYTLDTITRVKEYERLRSDARGDRDPRRRALGRDPRTSPMA